MSFPAESIHQPSDVCLAIGAPLSGPAADLGREMAQAAQLAVDEHNSLHELSIATTIIDDTGTPDGGTAVADQIVTQPDIVGVVGHYNSDVTIAASTVYARAGLPMITPIASSPLVTDRRLPGIFRWTNRDDRTAIAIAAYLRGVRQKRRAVIVESETAYGASMADQFQRAFTTAGGEVVLRRTIGARRALARGAGNAGAVNGTGGGLDAFVRELPAGFDLLFYGGTYDGAPLLRAMRAARMPQLFAAGDGCWDVKNFLAPAGAAALEGEGVLVLAAALAVGWMKGSADFASRYTARYGPIINYALNAYDSTRLLIDAVVDATQTAHGHPDRADVTAAIRRSVYQGLAYRDPVRWDDKGDNLTSLTALNVVRDGRFEQIAEIATT